MQEARCWPGLHVGPSPRVLTPRFCMQLFFVEPSATHQPKGRFSSNAEAFHQSNCFVSAFSFIRAFSFTVQAFNFIGHVSLQFHHGRILRVGCFAVSWFVQVSVSKRFGICMRSEIILPGMKTPRTTPKSARTWLRPASMMMRSLQQCVRWISPIQHRPPILFSVRIPTTLPPGSSRKVFSLGCWHLWRFSLPCVWSLFVHEIPR